MAAAATVRCTSGATRCTCPNRWNVDARYSRFVPSARRCGAEVIAEFKNIFNIVQTQGALTSIQVTHPGRAADANPGLRQFVSNPGGFVPNDGFEQREFQIGFKFYF